MPGAWDTIHTAICQYLQTKKKMYIVSTKLQAMSGAEKTANEVAARQFSVVPCKIRGGLVTLTASDNFGIAQIVRLLRTTMFLTALCNKKASQQPKYEY